MHEFTELVDRCITLTIESLNEINEKKLDALEKSANTGLVKTVQMIQLQKVILSVGIFSIFEAWLQDKLNCKDGFKTAKEILKPTFRTPIIENLNISKHTFRQAT